jgi:arylsulfatase A-like enzyme
MSTYQYPNILLMMTDQQRFDSLGSYGFEAGHTPNLDRLATEGVLFEHCYVNNPLCTPSRASMLTGKHIQGHGVYRLYDHLPEDQILFTEWLQQAGYSTALFGKLHVSSIAFEENSRNTHDGFDIYEWCLEHSFNMDSPFNGYVKWLKVVNPTFFGRLYRERRNLLHIPREVHLTHWAAERTIDFIRSHALSSQPFFCMMSVFDPHDPYEDYPLEMGDVINPKDIPAPLILEGEPDRSPKVLQRIRQEAISPLPPDSPLDAIRKARLGYHASIALIDLEFGRVLDTLKQAGVAENTLVIFVSDHGDLLGDHQQFGKGAALYDPCVRVPLIMSL